MGTSNLDALHQFFSYFESHGKMRAHSTAG
jgi:hypothetical protein